MAVNKIEVIKSAKDGLDVLPDLHRYAALAAAGEDPQIPADDFERLKWYGLFHRKRTPGHYMLRMRIPNGVLHSEQIEAIAVVITKAVGHRIRSRQLPADGSPHSTRPSQDPDPPMYTGSRTRPR